MYEDGADVVYARRRGIGSGVLEATAEAGEPGEVWTDRGRQRPLRAGRRRPPAVRADVDAQARRRRRVQHDREAKSTATFAAGVETYDLSVDGVGYSTSGGFIDAYVPTIEALEALIIDGTIVVPTAPEE